MRLKQDEFVFRPLKRKEYKELMQSRKGEYETQEDICKAAVVYPENYDFTDRGKAGVAKHLSEHIVAASGIAHPGQPMQMLENYRAEMQEFEAQAEVYISQAFKHITFDEMQEWTLDKLMQYLARAEFALKDIWQLPVSFDVIEEEGETEPQEPPTIEEMGQELRDMGLDPMMELGHHFRKKPPFVETPFIGGTKLLGNEEVFNRVREQVQRLSE